MGVHLPSGDDDMTLVRRIRAGDEIAFEALYYRYFASLCAFVLGRVDSSGVAEEIVQEVFASVWRHRAYWEVANVRTYLFGAVRNGATNAQRNQQTSVRWEARAAHETGYNGMGQASPGAEAVIQREELAVALDRVMRKLPERQQQAFDLRWRGGLAHAEIAEVMGITVKAVENTLRKAFKALRKDLVAYL